VRILHIPAVNDQRQLEYCWWCRKLRARRRFGH